MNAFNLSGPSILGADLTIRGTKSGKTFSQVSSQAAAKYQKRTGRSLGTITGLSPKADQQIRATRPA